LWQRDKGEVKSYGPIHFKNVLTAEDRAEFRWYLEEFLQFPYGAERWRAEQIEKRMAEWGEGLFNQVFVAGDSRSDPRAFYQEAVRDGLDSCELSIRSDDADFLNIPWELIREPGDSGRFLAPLLGGLYRQRNAEQIQPSPGSPGEGPFRMLLVIARPSDVGYIPLRTNARPIMEVLERLGERAALHVLRPPTLDSLQRHLNAHKGFYHLVHFDGHGVFADGSGQLALEKADGTADLVTSEKLGQLLASCRVPLFILNACQSAQEGETDPFSSVASQLVSNGITGVVAMSYSVYVDTATMFMERFYRELAEHKPLSEAVAAARLRLYAEPERQSVVGPIELQDWLVPALYQQHPGFVPIPEGSGVAPAESEEVGAVNVREHAKQACPEGQHGFIGRDDDILTIERALLDEESPWILISGIGGVGKTELVRGFARWYAATGGCPGGVFAASFKEKADFGQVLGSVAGFGTDFSRLRDAEQWDALVNFLRDNPCLLVWDNFEPVAGYPTGGEPLASDEERDKLSRFLKALKGGKSRVIITTRKPSEDWLEVAYRLVELSGLSKWDAGQLASVILQTVGRKPPDFKDDPDYSNLIALLGGHPRSFEIVLPQLRRKTPGEVIVALQNRVDSLGEAIEDASLAYAFSQLSERTRKHLPIIGLFASYANADTLGVFSAGQESSWQSSYQKVMEEAFAAPAWEAALEEAGDAGLLRSLGNRIFELHPTLAPFLRRQLVSQVAEGGLRRLDAGFVEFYGALASSYFEGVRTADPNALVAAEFEEANLLRALRLAGTTQQWEIAQVIAQTLSEFYEARSRAPEWRALRGGLLRLAGRDISAESDRDLANLWMFLLGGEANEALGRNELAAAEEAHRNILDYLTSLPDLDESKIAVAFHQLGRIAEAQQDFNEAEELYRKALEIREDLGRERLAASNQHQLGRVAQARQRFDEAAEWYRKALEIYERLGLERDAAGEYHQLGIVAHEQMRFDEAEDWYRKGLEIHERLGLERQAAASYQQIGGIARELQRSDEAEEWYRKALATNERLGLEREAAGVYHQLGNNALERRLEEAEEWYRKALEIYQRLRLERGAAAIYHQLGYIAQEQQRFEEAEKWYQKGLEAYETVGHAPFMIQTLAQIAVLHREQDHLAEAIRWFGKALAVAAEYQMPSTVQIMRDLNSLMTAMGEEAFNNAWRTAFDGQEPPLEDLEALDDSEPLG
jgi:tetratricopeptide (TPR) repeat protein